MKEGKEQPIDLVDRENLPETIEGLKKRLEEGSKNITLLLADVENTISYIKDPEIFNLAKENLLIGLKKLSEDERVKSDERLTEVLNRIVERLSGDFEE